ncbi:nuclear transport factor 2 family protein [Acidovorax sp. SUPP3334]|uniref:nuclear transport factor 2 family protein n=1 Tax=Acidovorax sp. SUPP3334 TaxID=2920881 RepID=UPI0023DE51E6|nr:nuclear transport factor 2 family protein [Acidovorax sp. SUPP3334]GKT24633.1 nuclear transport factor 2 family protein [Acidovorax sp. SUPP3334]
MQTTDNVLALLKALEVELHTPETRGNPARLGALLHDGFREFGRSGGTYAKADVLSQLPALPQGPALTTLLADRFEITLLSDAVALLTYRSVHRLADGAFDRWTLRTSIWERLPLGWQMRFHQGTPTAPFDPDA